MTLLAEMDCTVLYVEPLRPVTWSYRGVCDYRPSLKQVDKNLLVLKPMGKIPFSRFQRLRNLNLSLYARHIRATIHELQLQNPIVFAYLPHIDRYTSSLSMIDRLEKSLLIYDCVDNHSAQMSFSREESERVHQWDLELVSKADIVFVTAKGLLGERLSVNRNTHYSPNGVDTELYAHKKQQSTALPSDLEKIREPRVGFVGGIAEWIDTDLIARAAQALPECNFVLVGPTKPSVKVNLLRRCSNIHVLGQKPPDQIPRYLRGMACGINPFRTNTLANTVNPLKVYEYLAAGLPVVTTPMPELADMCDVLLVAEDEDDFIRCISTAVRGAWKPDPERVSSLLKTHDWRHIFDNMLTIIANQLDTTDHDQ